MKTERPHKKLLAWQKSMDLVVIIYSLTDSFPKHEVYGLTSQMRRAAVSVPSNVAEGAAGRSKDQFRNHLSIALGSLSELETQLEIAYRIGYLQQAKVKPTVRQLAECTALIAGLKNSIT
jgi:four helix bundle protein